MKRTMVVALSFVLLLAATPALAYEDNPGMIIVDTALVRPVSLAAIVIGTAAFIVTLPFALTSGTVDSTAQALVAEPFKFTFNRPVGDFSWKTRYGEVKKAPETAAGQGTSHGVEKQGTENPPASQ